MRGFGLGLAAALVLFGVTNALAGEAAWKRENQAGLAAYKQGKYAESTRHLKAALQAAESFGATDKRFAASLNNLAMLYRSQGRYAEAEPLYKRAFAIWEKTLGPEHPYTAQSLDNLAELHLAQGQYREAETLFKQALAIKESTLGGCPRIDIA